MTPTRSFYDDQFGTNIFGPNVWCQPRVPRFSASIWCQWLVPTFRTNIWCPCLVPWCQHLVPTLGTKIRYQHLVLTFGTNIWCQSLVPMFRTKVWCQFLVPIFGANFWCEFWSQPVVQILDRWATLYAHQPEPRLTTESRNVLRAISFRKVRVSEEMSSAIQKSPIGASFSEGSCSSWHFRMSDIIGSRGPIILSVKLAHCKNSH